MSSALLRFQPSSQTPKEMPLDLGILAAALDASPEPMAVNVFSAGLSSQLDWLNAEC